MYLLRKIWQRSNDPIFYRKKIRQLLQVGKEWRDEPAVHEIDALGRFEKAVVVIAHPDDETFCSGLIGELVDAGTEVSILCLTRGEGGPTGSFAREELGEIREKEMRLSSDILGVREIHFLNHVDPVANQFRVFAPDVSVRELSTQLRPFLKDADLVVSHGSHGEYWHAGHLLVFDAVKKAVSGIPDMTWLSFLARQPNHPIPHLVNWEDPVFLRLDVIHREEQRIDSIKCHESQLGLFGRFAGGTCEDFVRKTSCENFCLQQSARDRESD